MNDDRRLSDHPTDRLIRELIEAGRYAERGELDRILTRMAQAPFDPGVVQIIAAEQGLAYHGRALQRQDEALFAHLVRRVIADEQWAVGTTQEQYFEDLRQSIRAPSAKLALYQRRGGHVAATLTPTNDAVAAINRGRRSLPELWVVSSADRGIILTGYQVSNRDAISIPKDARWLL